MEKGIYGNTDNEFKKYISSLFQKEHILMKSFRNKDEISMFAYGPGGKGSIPGRVIPKTQKMALDAALLNTQHYKLRIKAIEVWSSALRYSSVW